MSQIKIFSKRFKLTMCWKCGKEFKDGEQVVVTGTSHQWPGSSHRTHNYHRLCYTDAHGIPIHE
ncbi:MAG: hypothetical protein E6L04_07430 [Thaumarchaeota archaeon]|nr:MAG: hypothetical protein E6L04_07430 [Nitrososphaerota archaeon]